MQKPSPLFEKISKYLIAAILIIVPLFPKFPLIKIPGSYVSIRFEDILLLFLGIIVVYKILFNVKAFLQDSIVDAFIIFFVVGLISLISGAFLTQTVVFKIGLLHLLRRLEYVMPFFAAILLLKKEQVSANLHFYIRILTLVVVVAFIYGFGQRYFNFPVIITQNEEYSKGIALFWTQGSHINSTFAGHYDLAAFMAIIVPIFITLAVTLKNKWDKILTLIVSGSGLWLLVNSLSRTGQVSYLFAVSISLILLRKFKILFAVLIVSVLLIGMSSGVEERFQRVFSVYYKKFNMNKAVQLITPNLDVLAVESTLPLPRTVVEAPISTPVPVFEDRSASIRINVEWPRAIRALLKNPILGTGYSSIDLATDNDYLRILGETGVLGFFAFCLIFLKIGKVFIPISSYLPQFPPLEAAFISGLFGGVVGTFMSAFFIDLLEASKFATIFWLLLGLGVYLVRSREYVQK